MRLLCIGVVCICVAPAILGAEDTKLPLISEKDRKLFSFCQLAILRDRGLSCFPLAGSSDKWILENLESNEQFRSVFDLAPELSGTADLTADQGTPDRGRKTKSDDILTFQRKESYSRELASKLTPNQLKKVPAVYLHLEGCMALCRPEFRPLFEDAETQNRVRRLTQQVFREKASPFHRMLFGLQSDDEAPIYQAELRRISADLDWQIVQALSDTERGRLQSFISKSWKLKNVTFGPPSF